jgi:hypothetical protein
MDVGWVEALGARLTGRISVAWYGQETPRGLKSNEVV